MAEQGTEKRQHPRTIIEEEIFCYLDGMRFDAGSKDISAGGLFLKTNREVPLGSVTALVFKGGEIGPAPIFLLGMVMRQQTEPFSGIGLQWVRAVTTGPSESLKAFLLNRMGLGVTEIAQEFFGPRRQSRHVYRFPVMGIGSPPGPASKPAARQPAAPTERGGSAAPTERGGPLRKMRQRPEQRLPATSRMLLQTDVRVRRSDGKFEERESRPLPPHVAKLSNSDQPGPLSMVVQRGDTLAATDLPACVEYAGREYEATVLGLGLKCMSVSVPVKPNSSVPAIKVRFSLPARGEPVPIVCHCKLLYVDESYESGVPRLELEIETYDEGKGQGLLWTYLKWLHFRSLKESEA